MVIAPATLGGDTQNTNLQVFIGDLECGSSALNLQAGQASFVSCAVATHDDSKCLNDGVLDTNCCAEKSKGSCKDKYFQTWGSVCGSSDSYYQFTCKQYGYMAGNSVKIQYESLDETDRSIQICGVRVLSYDQSVKQL